MSELVTGSRRFVKSLTMSKTNAVAAMARRAGVLRSRDMDAHKIPCQYRRLASQEGLVKRVGRGLYVTVSAQATTHHSLAMAAKRVSKGVICILSALRFHDLTTQAPLKSGSPSTGSCSSNKESEKGSVLSFLLSVLESEQAEFTDSMDGIDRKDPRVSPYLLVT
jgi:hypothetical protein